MSATISFRAENDIKSLLEAFAAKTHTTKTRIINNALAEKVINQVKILQMIDKDDD